MTTDNKTLADVQPGGRVRLGDQADAASAHDLETIERVAMAMQASENKQSGWTWTDCSSIEVEGWMDLARAAVVALSAQPSPGGQGDAQTIEKLRAMMDHSFGGPGFVVYGTEQSIAEVERRLAPGIAARQPVGELVAWVHEEDPSRVISASQKATALRDQGASGSSVRPYSVPAYLHAPAAQAVDLGQFRQPVQDWLDDAQASMEEHGDSDGVFGHAIEEGTRLLALIDSQAVGNG